MALLGCHDIDFDAGGAIIEDSLLPLDAEHPAPMAFAERLEHCPVLVLSRVPLAFNAIPSFIRVLDWLTIYQNIGVLEVILVKMQENIVTFLTLAGIICAAFSATFLAIIPELGTGWSHLDTGLADEQGHHAHGATAHRELKIAASGDASAMLDGSGAKRLYFSLSSAPYLPAFALFGDLGVDDLEEVAYKGTALNWGYINWAAVASWMYLFLSGILLVNLLIAMLSETYARVKGDADAEWMHRRVRVVDEFCGGTPGLPPPFSLPVVLMKMLRCCVRCTAKRGFEQLAESASDRDNAELDESREADLLSTTIPTSLLAQCPRQPDLVWLYDWLEEQDRQEVEKTRAERQEESLAAMRQQVVELDERLEKALAKQADEMEFRIHRAVVKAFDRAAGRPQDATAGASPPRSPLKTPPRTPLSVSSSWRDAAEDVRPNRAAHGAALPPIIVGTIGEANGNGNTQIASPLQALLDLEYPPEYSPRDRTNRTDEGRPSVDRWPGRESEPP